jgi:hypothetical protein
MKLFNYCFKERMGLESFQKFMEMCTTKNGGNSFNEDKHILNLIVLKAWTLQPDVREIFIANLYNLFKKPVNVSSFLKASQSFEFIYEFITNPIQGNTIIFI